MDLGLGEVDLVEKENLADLDIEEIAPDKLEIPQEVIDNISDNSDTKSDS